VAFDVCLGQWPSRVCCIKQTQHSAVSVRGESVELSGGVSASIVLDSTNTKRRRHGHLKNTWRNSCCQPDADALINRLRCRRRHSNTTSAQLNPLVALTGRPGQSCDVGGRLGWLLGITAKFTSCNFRYNSIFSDRSANLKKNKFNILKPRKLYGYVKSVQVCQVRDHLSHSNLILCLMKIFQRVVSSPSIRVGLNILSRAARLHWTAAHLVQRWPANWGNVVAQSAVCPARQTTY